MRSSPWRRVPLFFTSFCGGVVRQHGRRGKHFNLNTTHSEEQREHERKKKPAAETKQNNDEQLSFSQSLRACPYMSRPAYASRDRDVQCVVERESVFFFTCPLFLVCCVSGRLPAERESLRSTHPQCTRAPPLNQINKKQEIIIFISLNVALRKRCRLPVLKRFTKNF